MLQWGVEAGWGSPDPEMLAVRAERHAHLHAALGQLAEAHPELNIGCYPFQKDGRYGANVVIRGVDAGQVDTAIAELAGTFPA